MDSNYRADILNRGFGGYTSSIALALINSLSAGTLTGDAFDSLKGGGGSGRKELLVGIFFGANDACGSHHYMVSSPYL